MDESTIKEEETQEVENTNDESTNDSVETVQNEVSANESVDIYDTINEELSKIRAEVISIRDTVNQFVDMGGVIREVDMPDNQPEIEEYEYTPIESLDLSL